MASSPVKRTVLLCLAVAPLAFMNSGFAEESSMDSLELRPVGLDDSLVRTGKTRSNAESPNGRWSVAIVQQGRTGTPAMQRFHVVLTDLAQQAYYDLPRLANSKPTAFRWNEEGHLLVHDGVNGWSLDLENPGLWSDQRVAVLDRVREPVDGLWGVTGPYANIPGVPLNIPAGAISAPGIP